MKIRATERDKESSSSRNLPLLSNHQRMRSLNPAVRLASLTTQTFDLVQLGNSLSLHELEVPASSHYNTVPQPVKSKHFNS